jgi:hypothetical protein
MWRFLDFGDFQHTPVESSRFILVPGRHCKLDVIYVTDLHCCTPYVSHMHFAGICSTRLQHGHAA